MIISTAWGVLVAKHLQTDAVSEQLNMYGFEHFIPKIESLRIVKCRHVRELRPMLGDYILTSITSAWESLLSLKHVAGMILNADGYPAQVQPNELKRMHDMCDAAGTYYSEIDTTGFQYGQYVRATEGPFINFTGTYDSKNKRGEDVALFILFGREQKVTFKPGGLLAV
jgi:transcription antitermination factor NusG